MSGSAPAPEGEQWQRPLRGHKDSRKGQKNELHASSSQRGEANGSPAVTDHENSRLRPHQGLLHTSQLACDLLSQPRGPIRPEERQEKGLLPQAINRPALP